MNNVIKIDSLIAVLNLSKADCEQMIIEIKALVTNKEPKITFQNVSALKKLFDMIDKVLKDEEIKKQAQLGFLDQFGGSKTELVYGYKTTLTQTGVYKYSDELQKEIDEYEKLGKLITAKKEFERKSDIATKIDTKDNLSFTLK